MGFLRYFVQRLINNEQLINRLADSKPIRRGAQFVVYILARMGSVGGIQHNNYLTQRLRSFINNFQKELKEAKEELKKK